MEKSTLFYCFGGNQKSFPIVQWSVFWKLHVHFQWLLFPNGTPIFLCFPVSTFVSLTWTLRPVWLIFLWRMSESVLLRFWRILQSRQVAWWGIYGIFLLSRFLQLQKIIIEYKFYFNNLPKAGETQKNISSPTSRVTFTKPTNCKTNNGHSLKKNKSEK